MKIVHALKVKQWLKTWDKVVFDTDAHKAKPQKEFYIFSLSASELQRLTGINRRTSEPGTRKSKVLGSQRGLQRKRLNSIREFIKRGFPASEKPEDRDGGMRMPGWLPTAIVVNIFDEKIATKRAGSKIASARLIKVTHKDGDLVELQLPDGEPSADFYPMEVIDGQHRLWAFKEDEGETLEVDGDFQFPVVAFHGLDFSWEAYLFWIINISPKKINRSLAFDLMPLLRVTDWLDTTDEKKFFREIRAQELVEALWSNNQSPWKDKIDMLGDLGGTHVSQASWINAIASSFLRSKTPKKPIGGLFQDVLPESDQNLQWKRYLQAALLVLFGKKLKHAIGKSDAKWIAHLSKDKDKDRDPFYGKKSLLNTDMGIRTLMFILNALLYMGSKELALASIDTTGVDTVEEDDALNEEWVSQCIAVLERHAVSSFLDKVATALADFDWRTSGALHGTSAEEQDLLEFKKTLRGGSGYKNLRERLLKHLNSGKRDKQVLAISSEVLRAVLSSGEE